MQVTIKGITENAAAFKAAGIKLPEYDVRAVQEHSKAHPVWVHLGAGNIFRGFIGSLQQELLNRGEQKSGIIPLSNWDAEVRTLIHQPHDSLAVNVTLLPDKNVELEVLGSVVPGLLLDGSRPDCTEEAKRIFRSPDLQILSFTITEKGYALTDVHGKFTAGAEADFAAGPAKPRGAMAITAALLLERYQNGALPMAVLSMDNCSHNGEKLKSSVVTVAREWLKRGFVDQGFIDYLEDENKVSFPWSMIDKITPRPDPEIAARLKDLGLEAMDPIKTAKGSFIAPFINAEKPQYLVIEDRFPNGRPPLDKVGVKFCSREGVDMCERMKVTTCLNPLHTALAVYGCILGYTRINAEMDDADLVALIKKLGYDEGLKVVDDPKILSPKAFIDEVITERLPNRCLPDAPQRIATDTSLKMPIRFGETLKNYKRKGMSTDSLIALPLTLAGWLRYLLAVDDNGQPFELSDDPQIPDLKKNLEGVKFGDPSSVGDKLRPILENATIFGVNLYEAGIAGKVEELFGELISGPGAVRATLKKYL